TNKASVITIEPLSIKMSHVHYITFRENSNFLLHFGLIDNIRSWSVFETRNLETRDVVGPVKISYLGISQMFILFGWTNSSSTELLSDCGKIVPRCEVTDKRTTGSGNVKADSKLVLPIAELRDMVTWLNPFFDVTQKFVLYASMFCRFPSFLPFLGNTFLDNPRYYGLDFKSHST
ncbi:hypothetical protein L9F63_005865, partial [Diploptera punctata]